MIDKIKTWNWFYFDLSSSRFRKGRIETRDKTYKGYCFVVR